MWLQRYTPTLVIPCPFNTFSISLANAGPITPHLGIIYSILVKAASRGQEVSIIKNSDPPFISQLVRAHKNVRPAVQSAKKGEKKVVKVQVGKED
jgi:hypothetical protein